jgi:hypothetical protein
VRRYRPEVRDGPWEDQIAKYCAGNRVGDAIQYVR